MTNGIVLFAHGSRDSGWAKPFEALASQIRARVPAVEVVVAYLEIMKPSLEDAVRALAAKKISSVRIVPVFLAAGGHVREDLPTLVSALRASYPAMDIAVEVPIGEQPAVIEAIAASISRPAGRSSP